MPADATAPISDRAPAPRLWPVCPVCAAGREQRRYAWFATVGFAKCGSCGVVYKAFEAAGCVADFYEAGYFHGRKSARDRRFEHRVRKCQRQLRTALHWAPVRRVLDIGCSFGYVLEAARRLGLQAHGSDISRYAVQVCQARGYRSAVGSLEAQPFADAAFDLVTMKHVLEHTAEPYRALAEVHRVLAPGGLAFVVVPSLRYFKARWWRQSCRYFRPDDLGIQHYVYYTRATLQHALQKAGFTVLADSRAFARPQIVERGGTRAAVEKVRCWALQGLRRLAAVWGLEREVTLIAQRSRAATKAPLVGTDPDHKRHPATPG